ncbi:FecR domain-containing protein [Janthinobacterium fluminis]|uniref:FecR domain-containing protein n=1 Tax=Janthinobacterium fluminis TaxID=2987524 RepID=A0ABT5JWE6_9BURK|nr:FecR domain-containing protein [Janthinobacterium fluminis]MDC8756949.1 FecR domain-containing protein [Janthinobacterium fluminis]
MGGFQGLMDASAPPLAGGADTPRVAQAVAEQAVQWWIALQDGADSPAHLAAWQRWRAADPEHEIAWQRIEAVTGQLADIPLPLAKAALAAPASVSRRRAVRLLTALVVVGGAAATVRQSSPWQSWLADESTATGERRTLQLPDGGSIVLNTRSAINVCFDAERRVVQLLRGEVLVQTAPDTRQRPFIVHTSSGTVRALGTRFTVRQQDDAVNVGVLQGAVELRPADAPSALRLLRAKEEGSFTRALAQPASRLDEGAGAWADGMLVVSHMRLDHFLAELGRHRPGHVACAPAIAHLQVSGAYPLDDTDAILAGLTSSLPVELQFFTRYWVRVRPRQRQR